MSEEPDYGLQKNKENSVKKLEVKVKEEDIIEEKKDDVEEIEENNKVEDQIDDKIE